MHISSRQRGIYLFILVITIFVFITIISSPKAFAYTPETGCSLTGDPINQKPNVQPKATINVNVTAPSGLINQIEVTLKNSGGSELGKVMTCGNLGAGAGSTVSLKTAFFDVEPDGQYTVCINTVCSNVTVTKSSTTGKLVGGTVNLTITGAAIPIQTQDILVTVRMKVTDPTVDTTYGPVPVTMVDVASGDKLLLVNTSAQSYVKGAKPGTVSLTALFTKATTGVIYQACIFDKLSICSATVLKKANENAKLTIDLDETQSYLYSGSNSAAATCGSVVTGVGWMVCPIVNALVGLNDTMWGAVNGLLLVNPLTNSAPIYEAWGTIRNIANVLFAIFFMIIIFSQLTSIGISNYGIKKLLPRIIICAICVNTSFIIIQVAVDLANIVGSSLHTILTSFVVKGSVPEWGPLLTIIFTGAASTAIVLGIAALAPGAAFMLLMPGAFMGMLGLGAALLTLAVRQAIIPILAILAPLAFVAYLLPNTQIWFKKWKDALMSMLLLYPMAAIVFGGAKFASSIIVATGPGQFWPVLVGLLVLTMPLFSLPFLLRQSGPILSGINGALGRIAENARAPITNAMKDRADTAQALYTDPDAGPRTRLGRWADPVLGFNRRHARASTARKMERANIRETSANKLEDRAMSDAGIQSGLNRRVSIRGSAYNREEAKRGLADAHREIDTLVNDNALAANRRTYASTEDNERSKHDNNERQFADATLDPLRARREDSKERSETAEDRAATRIEPGLLQVRAARSTAAKDLESAKRVTKTRIEQAAAGQYVPGIDAATSAELVNSADQTTITTENLEQAEAEVASRVEGVAGVIDAKVANTTAKGTLEVAQGHTKQVIEELKAVDRPGTILSADAARIATTNPGLRTQLQTDVLEGSAVASATAAATSMQNQDVAEALIAAGAELPGGLAYRSAGVRGVQGISGVRAKATSAQAQFRQETVSAAETLYTSGGYTSGTDGELMDIATSPPGWLDPRTGLEPTSEEREAAMKMVVATGSNNSMARLLNYMDSLPPAATNPETLTMRQAFGRIVGSSSKKAKAISGGMLGALSAGQATGTFEAGIIAAAGGGKVAPKSFIAMETEEVEMWGDTLGSALAADPTLLSTAQKDELRVSVQAALNNPDVRNEIVDEKVPHLQAILDSLA
ncbi:MAG: hypothetical protein WCK26_03240 [Candidatus Saccharibacteria bacterium]